MTNPNAPIAATLLVCNCQRSMEIDGAKLAAALSQPGNLTVHTELCRGQLAAFEAALAKGGPLHVACTQEAPLFEEVAAEKSTDDSALRFTDIRDRAGWTEAKGGALPKMAALIAASAYDEKPAGQLTLTSQGVCLVYGAGQQALDIALELAGRLSVTLLLSDAGDALPPRTASVSIAKGVIRKAKGHLGAFAVDVDGYAQALPSSWRQFAFTMPRNGAASTCDLILDVSGRTPLFADSARRDGYIRVDPRDPAAVARAMFKAADLVGEFEKPRYVAYDAAICAHARSAKIGCSNCLDVCPTGAIAPDGDHVVIDAAVCGGCGSCSAVCPTGAVAYDYPTRGDFAARAQILLQTYARAGGTRSILLLGDDTHGGPMVSAMARFGRGLPPHVLPLTLSSVFQLGHDALAVMLASGAEQIVILAPPNHASEMTALEAQRDVLAAILTGLGHDKPRLHILDETDPDAVEAALYGLAALPALKPASFAVQGAKREVARLALSKLYEAAPLKPEVIVLPKAAPYGRIAIDTKGCTLCLSCVGACPANALADNPERPEIAFTEAACVQCGICVATCPEKVITLEPRYNFTTAALSPVVLNTQEPFCCVSCGKAFGAKASIDKVLAKLKGHAMFNDDSRLRLIQMCDLCRITAMAEGENDPFRSAARPMVRTTADYLAAEAQAKSTGRKPEDFLN